MKKIIVFFSLALLCLAVSCDLFFSNNTGEEGAVTLSLGARSAYTGVPDDAAYTGTAPVGDDGRTVYPDLGEARFAVYDGSGKALRNYTFSGDQSSWTFSVPAGGPYWVDFSAPVQRPANIETDPFPCVKSFGATIKLDAVAGGSSQDLVLPLRVRETAIMAPYKFQDGTVKTDVWALFYDLPRDFENLVGYVERGAAVGNDNLCLDFDPYGRLLTTAERGGEIGLIKVEKFKTDQFISNITAESVAFNLRDGNVYYTSGSGYRYSVHKVSAKSFLESIIEEITDFIFPGSLTSPFITIDEEGAFYTISGEKIYRTTDNGQSVNFDIADIIDPAGQEWGEADVDWNILDLKALNGYLYVLLYVHVLGNDHYYDYFAAVPLESIKKGAVKGAAWFTGGKSVDELDGDHASDPYSLNGFFGPKKITGWGPDRLYVYDSHDMSDGFHRIVEVDLRNRRISKAGLVLRSR
ncbi:MAG: hypothetical protein LBG10_05080 [Treponema sp.]|jgi:hypothetical protein|nr:hypothetical protein [Treponema sp.]